MEKKTKSTPADKATQTFTLYADAKHGAPASDKWEFDIPDIEDLTNCLRFVPSEGRIWFDNERVSLIHLSSLGFIRQQLIDKLGEKEARGLLTRMGYASGAKDAVVARRLRARQSLGEAFLTGPQLHAIQGVVYVVPVRVEADTESGHYYGEFIWHKCFDAESHLAIYGEAKNPVCWMQIGYASGYTSAFMGRPIFYKEVECKAVGDAHCRIIGKPLEDWDPKEIEAEVQALQPQKFANRFSQLHDHDQSQPAKIIYGSDKALSMLENMVGASPAFTTTCHLAQKVAGTSATVLFLGETGVGKGIFAKTLHQISDRFDKPFISLNCSAIPESLIESELFGVVKGAFTGATESRPGRFERAHGGTLFLDEVGTLTMTAQIKLLRALQEKEIERVGDSRTRKVDVRIIAATNVNLQEAVKAGSFREDLMFRLNVFPINIPPLRERREDIPLLMDHFLHRFTRLHNKQVSGFTNLAVDALYQYEYPGNIRELDNLIERAVIMVENHQAIDLHHLFVSEDLLQSVLLKVDPTGALQQKSTGLSGEKLFDDIFESHASYDEVEYGLITEAIKRANGNISEAARLLGVKRAHIAYRLRTDKQNN